MTRPRPDLRIVRGNATAEEIAAVVAVLAARSSAPTAPTPAPSLWRRSARRLQQQLHPGPGAWRSSTLPH
jgi:hypothetical protein